MAILDLHAREPIDTSSADEVEQQGLHRIVLMVGHGNHVKPMCLAQPLKLAVAKFAGSHLYGLLVLRGIGRGVEVCHFARHAKRAAQVGDKLLVAVALFAPKVEVAVHGMAVVAQPQ